MAPGGSQPLTATGCLKKLRADIRATDDVGNKKKRRNGLSPSAIAATVGSLDEEPPKKTAGKAYNVYLQLADASGSSAPPGELDPNDVPAWRTKMCKNRIAILQTERRKVEQKKQEVQRKIEEKIKAQHLAAADLTWKKKEIEYVAKTIGDFRQDLARRETEVAEHQHEQREAILASTAEIGAEMRAAQRSSETGLLELSEYYLAEKKRTNLESTKLQTETLTNLFQSIAMEKTVGGEQLREQRVKNTQTIKTVAAAELARVQALNETVKKEQELSAARLKEKLDHTQRTRTAEYLKNRTVQFNDFKKAASVTNNMQEETAAIVEQLREAFETTRDLERKLDKM
mmetsp:Transcript_11845/g.29006  ORF Transcript_11845/g.29006 Transcript_11845/m.29006 type:complete len:344 (-) Transcript_11845:63-1094(-)